MLKTLVARINPSGGTANRDYKAPASADHAVVSPLEHRQPTKNSAPLGQAANHTTKGELVQTELIDSRPRAGSPISSRSQTLGAAAFTAFLGAFLIWGVGFCSIEIVHNGAHDTRHSSAFPCH
jgi:cobalt transporter subunit CbtB